jgi:carbonic anhydrase
MQGIVLSTLRALVILVGTAIVVSLAAQHAPEAWTAGRSWTELAAGNQRFATGKLKPHDLVTRRKQLVNGQNPHTTVLSCSDSRVPPEMIFDQNLGDLFVVRSAGESADPLSVGSIEYAFAHLGTTLVVVMGHQSCGAVTAACSGEKEESPNLEAVVTPITASCSKIDKTRPETLDLAVRDHVHSVADQLLAQSALLKKAVDDGKLTIVEAYYSLDTGKVTKLR